MKKAVSAIFEKVCPFYKMHVYTKANAKKYWRKCYYNNLYSF